MDRVLIKRWSGSVVEVPPLYWTRDDQGAVILSCENGHLAMLQHDIDSEGNVDPSILCYGTGKDPSGCGWHVFAKLEDFDG